MIHPDFEQIEDPYVAEVFSELFRPTAYKFWSSDKDWHEGIVFPPEPAYLTNILAAYFEPISEENSLDIRCQMAILDPDRAPAPQQFSELYEENVGRAQKEFLPALLKVTRIVTGLENPEKIQQWYTERVHERQKLLAAFMVTRVMRTGKLLAALAYPTFIMEQLPLQIREGAVNILPVVRLAIAGAQGKDHKLDEIYQSLQELLRNDRGNQYMGLAAASAFLPDADAIKNILNKKLPD